LLVLFLGSNDWQFLIARLEKISWRAVREILRPGDALLLGTDLEKDVATQLLRTTILRV